MSIIAEALKGAKAHVAAAPVFREKVHRAGQMAKILIGEIAAIAAMAPYGIKTMSLYKSLPTLSPPAVQSICTEPATGTAAGASRLQAPAKCPLGVAVHRDIAYGPLPRSKLDVYVPEAVARAGQSSGQNAPVVFFCHGGVWASGEKWHYAPMAVRMAQEGCIVVVITYTLYPEGLIDQMVWEVSRALSWTLDNVGQYGGDASRVTAVGHSAGGHLISMALLTRAMAAHRVATRSLASLAHMAEQQQQQQEQASTSVAQPALVTAAAATSSASVDDRQHQSSSSDDEGSSRPSRLEAASYLLGAGTSLPSALHSLKAVTHAQAQAGQSGEAEWAARHKQKQQQQQQATGMAASASSAPDGVLDLDVPARLMAWWGEACEPDGRMPAAFIGMSAVYDIAKHYEFERSRNVHEISMMKRVMGGRKGFDAFSPTIILGRAVAAAQERAHPAHHPVEHHAEEHVHFFQSFPLMGEAITLRAGLTDHFMPASAAAVSGNGSDQQRPQGDAITINMNGTSSGDGSIVSSREAPCETFSLEAAQYLPPHVIMGSCADHMVPWHEGAALADSLRRAGVPHKLLLYNHTLHSDFALAWPMLKRNQLQAHNAVHAAGGSHLRRKLQPFAQDFFKLVFGEVDVMQACATAYNARM